MSTDDIRDLCKKAEANLAFQKGLSVFVRNGWAETGQDGDAMRFTESFHDELRLYHKKAFELMMEKLANPGAPMDIEEIRSIEIAASEHFPMNNRHLGLAALLFVEDKVESSEKMECIFFVTTALASYGL